MAQNTIPVTHPPTHPSLKRAARLASDRSLRSACDVTMGSPHCSSNPKHGRLRFIAQDGVSLQNSPLPIVSYVVLSVHVRSRVRTNSQTQFWRGEHKDTDYTVTILLQRPVDEWFRF